MALQKRDKNKIISQILEVCEGEGASKTKIVYVANLNFNTVNPYIVRLTNGGLIEVLDGPIIVYRTTAKGADTFGDA